jgi:hypothetical protein
VRSWAQKLGGELWHVGELVTRRTRVNEVVFLTTTKKCVKRIGVAELQETHRRQRGERRDHLEGDPRKNLQHDQGESGGGERECPGVSPSATVTFSCRGSWT